MPKKVNFQKLTVETKQEEMIEENIEAREMCAIMKADEYARNRFGLTPYRFIYDAKRVYNQLFSFGKTVGRGKYILISLENQ